MNLLFANQFAQKVIDGTKRQTIRPPRKDGKPICKVGDMLSPRQWEGVAYRSNQVKLIEDTVCESVSRVLLSNGPTGNKLIFVNGCLLPMLTADDFAKADGFKDVVEMFEYFNAAYVLPFEGVLICW